MKILTLTTFYPNPAEMHNGIFVEHKNRVMLQNDNIDIEVIAPIPWFPFVSKRFPKYNIYAGAPKSNHRYGIDIIHPRYAVIPKIGENISPFLLAGALIHPLKRLIKSGYDFDVIDSYYLYPDGVAAALLGRYFNKPVVITALGSDVNIIPKQNVPRRLIQWATKNASGLTAVSQALKDNMVGLGINEDAIEVIRHGVDQQLFSPSSDRSSLRSELGLVRKTLFSVGNLIELKGHHIVIKALPMLPFVDLVIAGVGKEESNLKFLAQQHGVEDRVRFLGIQDQGDLKKYYAAADAFILASRSEGIPNVILESLACGTPVIATQVGGIPEVIKSKMLGILMKDRSPDAVVAAVNDLFSSYPERGAIREYVEKYFTWDQTAEKHFKLLNNL